MREIKFRAWNGKKMIYRNLHDRNWYSEDLGGKVIQGTHPDDKRLMAIMQFTGLKDKNGVDVYEGDIIQDTDKSKYVILWDSEDAKFVSVSLPDYILDSESRYDEKGIIWVISERIGNIHQNEELLK